MQTYIGFLRGINVRGHHKVPMADLKAALSELGCKNMVTILNSGNVIFDLEETELHTLEIKIATHLEQRFGFGIPTFIKTKTEILSIIKSDPFESEEITVDKRAYITFFRPENNAKLNLPWVSEDGAYKILECKADSLISVLDVTVSKTTKAMAIVERSFGKDVTTRNWKTLIRIEKKLLA